MRNLAKWSNQRRPSGSPRQKQHKRKLELQLNMVAKLWDLSLIHKSNTWPRKRQGSMVLSDMPSLTHLPSSSPFISFSKQLSIAQLSLILHISGFRFLAATLLRISMLHNFCGKLFLFLFAYPIGSIGYAEDTNWLVLLSSLYVHLHFFGYLQVVHVQQLSHLIRFSLFCFFFSIFSFLSKLVYRRKIIVTDANIYDKYKNSRGGREGARVREGRRGLGWETTHWLSM